MKGNVKSIVFCLYIFFVLLMVNCSYGMDYMEASITGRSSFSIDGNYNADGTITLNWSDASNKVTYNAFAGYEIYISKQSDDEFVGYTALCAPYNLGDSTFVEVDSNGNPRESTFTILRNPNLRNSSITHASIELDTIFNGVLFFRVGIIEWDLDTQEKRAQWKPDASGNTFVEYVNEYDPDDKNEWFYINRTSLVMISAGKIINVNR